MGEDWHQGVFLGSFCRYHDWHFCQSTFACSCKCFTFFQQCQKNMWVVGRNNMDSGRMLSHGLKQQKVKFLRSSLVVGFRTHTFSVFAQSVRVSSQGCVQGVCLHRCFHESVFTDSCCQAVSQAAAPGRSQYQWRPLWKRQLERQRERDEKQRARKPPLTFPQAAVTLPSTIFPSSPLVSPHPHPLPLHPAWRWVDRVW